MNKASDILKEVSLFESFFTGLNDFKNPVVYGVDKKLTEAKEHYSISDLLRMDEKVFLNSVRSLPALQGKPKMMKAVFEGLAILRNMSSNGGRIKPEMLKVLEKVFGFSDVQKTISSALQSYNKKIGYDPIAMKSEAKQDKDLSVYIEINNNGKITRMEPEAFRKSVGGAHSMFAQDWVDKYNIDKGSIMARLVYAKNGKEIGKKVESIKERSSDTIKMKPDDEKKIALLKASLLNTPLVKKKEVTAQIDSIKAKYESLMVEGKKEKWLAAFEDAVVAIDKKHIGKIDWNTAQHLFNIGDTPKEAAEKYTANRKNESRSIKTETADFIKGSIFAEDSKLNEDKVVTITHDNLQKAIDAVMNDQGYIRHQRLNLEKKTFEKFKKAGFDLLKPDSDGRGFRMQRGKNTEYLFAGHLQLVLWENKNVTCNLTEGGPGSGGQYPTQKIKMPLSPFISVGTRKGILKNMPFEIETVPLSKITHVAQRKFVPFKVKTLCKNPDGISKKPICLLKVPSEDAYHVMDGHHRYLAAMKKGMDSLDAKVWVKFEEPKVDEPIAEEPPIANEIDLDSIPSGEPDLAPAEAEAIDVTIDGEPSSIEGAPVDAVPAMDTPPAPNVTLDDAPLTAVDAPLEDEQIAAELAPETNEEEEPLAVMTLDQALESMERCGKALLNLRLIEENTVDVFEKIKSEVLDVFGKDKVWPKIRGNKGHEWLEIGTPGAKTLVLYPDHDLNGDIASSHRSKLLSIVNKYGWTDDQNVESMDRRGKALLGMR